MRIINAIIWRVIQTITMLIAVLLMEGCIFIGGYLICRGNIESIGLITWGAYFIISSLVFGTIFTGLLGVIWKKLKKVILT